MSEQKENDKVIHVDATDMAFITAADTLIKEYITVRLKELRKADNKQAARIACQIAHLVTVPKLHAFMYVIGSVVELEGLFELSKNMDAIMQAEMGDCI